MSDFDIATIFIVILLMMVITLGAFLGEQIRSRATQENRAECWKEIAGNRQDRLIEAHKQELKLQSRYLQEKIRNDAMIPKLLMDSQHLRIAEAAIGHWENKYNELKRQVEGPERIEDV